MRRVEASLGGLLLVLACERAPAARGDAPVSPQQALRLDRSVLTQLEQSLGVTPERARELATEDALLATELERLDPKRAEGLQRVALARTLAHVLLEEASRSGPPTDAEIDQLTRERWWEFDRPRMVGVVHAVVVSESESMQAEGLAREIAKAVASAKDATEFENAAGAVPTQNFSVKVETLPPVARDGRALDPEQPPPAGPPEQHFAEEFAVAAQALDHVGQLSPVVRTPFGYHVMRCLRIVEPQQLPLEERRTLLAPEVLQRRALAAQRESLDRQRRENQPEQARSALTAMAQLVTAQ